MGFFIVVIMKKMWQKSEEKRYIIFPAITLFCLAGWIGSLLLPDKVLDTYSVNMTEEEGDTEELLSLAEGNHVRYQMDTKGIPMKGIQVGINKQGREISGILHYDVYVMKDGNETLASSNVYDLSEGYDLQYVYLPYDGYEKCTGQLSIDFYTQDNTAEVMSPALMANHTMTADTVTMSTADPQFSGSLKGSYIYTHDTYPFLYDFRIMTCIFLAASMAVHYPHKNRRGGKQHEAGA
ncbi:MAG: hypothetical protein E7294_03300 [Lachnospiraceae bacterium]|jgi:hypothetical protein|nr:hypothetical protein [Lachnospiraceae bacterium]